MSKKTRLPRKESSPKQRPLAKMAIPAVIVIALANLLVPNPDPNDTRAVIEAATACGNFPLLAEVYGKLIEKDFLNLEYHRGYILSRSKDVHQEQDETGQNGRTLEERYQAYAADADSAVSDIGHYGLGYCRSRKKDYEGARAHYSRVRNKSLEYLNNSLGFVHLKLGEYEAAKRCFREEIRLGGNLDGAYSNLSRTLLETREYEELDKLIRGLGAREHVEGPILRLNHFIRGEYWQYFLQATTLRDFTYTGLICAFLVLVAWFIYLRRLDVFEPEKYSHLLLTLVLGMAFSQLAFPSYDFFRVYLQFSIDGSRANDFLFCIFGIGLIEELVKIVPVLIILKWTKAINESVDFIIYASVSALGFAFMENLLYFRDDGLRSVSARALICVLGHMSFSSIAIYGLFYAKYRDGHDGKKNYLYFALSFGAACLLHGIYDFWMIAEDMGAWVLVTPLVFLLVVDQFGRIVNTALNHSEFMPHQRETLVDNGNYLVYALSAVLMLEYLSLSLLFGPENANCEFFYRLIILYAALLIIAFYLGSFRIRPKQWTPSFGRRVPREVGGGG